jgi:UDP-2,3-diacylglucosamine hydrolase
LKAKNKTYFISDVHLGADTRDYPSIEREKMLVDFLDSIKQESSAIYLMGDIFDFWFEYKRAVPKGFSRFLGKIAEITDSGIPVYFFCGNHDMWTFGYLEREIGVNIVRNTLVTEISGKKFFLAHGDGLGSYDKSYNILKRIFRSRFFQFLFRLIHPDCGIWLARTWSGGSRKRHKYPKKINPEDEWLVKYAKSVMKNDKPDFFIFGHRHIPFQHELDNNCLFTNLGDWMMNFSYAVFDGTNLELKNLKK